MRNRAKCRLCLCILESFHQTDIVTCKCGEISISGGLVKYECSAKNWNNFIRIDDENKEVIPKIVEKTNQKDMDDVEKTNQKDMDDVEKQNQNSSGKFERIDKPETKTEVVDKIELKPTKEQLTAMLDEMIKSVESLPQAALLTPVNHYDLVSALLLIKELFKAES